MLPRVHAQKLYKHVCPCVQKCMQRCAKKYWKLYFLLAGWQGILYTSLRAGPPHAVNLRGNSVVLRILACLHGR